MKKQLILSALIFVLFSCSKIKENRKFKNYVGDWEVTQIDSICYSPEGVIKETFDLTATGFLNLKLDRTYSSENLNQLYPSSNWNLFFHGRKDVLLLKNDRFTVFKKKKNSMQIDFTKGEDGSLDYVKRFYLNKK